MDTAIEIVKILGEVLVTYLLKNKILDLLSRILQGIIAPLDYVIRKLEQTYTSIARLNYRQRVLNLVLVSISIVMLFSEFSTLKEILNTTATTDPIEILGLQVTVGTFAAGAYMTISIILGFMSLELFHIRGFFQGIFFNDPPDVSIETEKDSPQGKPKISRVRKWMAMSFFAILLLLAILQGLLAIQRFQLSKKVDVVPRLEVKFALTLFYFVLGFLTPIMAAFALLSFDVVIALIAKFIAGIIQFIQKMAAVVFMAIEVIIHVISSPIEKIMEFFGIYQERNINERNKDQVKPAIRLAPLENNSPVYLNNLASIYRLSSSLGRHDGTLMFISDTLAVNFLVPSRDIKISANTTFDEIADYIKKEYVSCGGRVIEFKYVDSEGKLCSIALSHKVIDYTGFTETIIIDAFFKVGEKAQGAAV
ncbi:MAG: hypothetical protein DMF61_06395 [Blastocatellia bacterium AA13]|nr:MAG: hypothetical protein DMF61_06395 [Blastocatellia bacterium AA13]